MDKLKSILIEMLNEYTIDSTEARKILGLSRSRFATLKATGKLTPIKGNIYFKVDVIKRLESQELLRNKHYKRVLKNIPAD